MRLSAARPKNDRESKLCCATGPSTASVTLRFWKSCSAMDRWMPPRLAPHTVRNRRRRRFVLFQIRRSNAPCYGRRNSWCRERSSTFPSPDEITRETRSTSLSAGSSLRLRNGSGRDYSPNETRAATDCYTEPFPDAGESNLWPGFCRIKICVACGLITSYELLAPHHGAPGLCPDVRLAVCRGAWAALPCCDRIGSGGRCGRIPHPIRPGGSSRLDARAFDRRLGAVLARTLLGMGVAGIPVPALDEPRNLHSSLGRIILQTGQGDAGHCQIHSRDQYHGGAAGGQHEDALRAIPAVGLSGGAALQLDLPAGGISFARFSGCHLKRISRCRTSHGNHRHRCVGGVCNLPGRAVSQIQEVSCHAEGAGRRAGRASSIG